MSTRIKVVVGLVTKGQIHVATNFIKSFILTRSERFAWTLIVADRADDDKLLNQLIADHSNNTGLIYINCAQLSYAQSYNMIFECLQHMDWSFAFMARDAVFFKKRGWDDKYYDTSMSTNIPYLVHYSHMLRNPTIGGVVNSEKNLQAYTDALRSMGHLFTITPEVIEKVGFFNELFTHDGHEDQEYTIRCCQSGFNNINTLFDIKDSNKLIEIRCPPVDKKAPVPKEVDQNKRCRDMVLQIGQSKLSYGERKKIIYVIVGDKNCWKDIDVFTTINEVTILGNLYTPSNIVYKKPVNINRQRQPINTNIQQINVQVPPITQNIKKSEIKQFRYFEQPKLRDQSIIHSNIPKLTEEDVINELNNGSGEHLFITMNPKIKNFHCCKLSTYFIHIFKKYDISTLYLNNINIFINTIKYKTKRYNILLIDAMLMNPVISGSEHEDLINKINMVREYCNTVIFLYHDMHYWSFDSRISILGSDLFEKNNYYYYNLDLLKKIGVEHSVALYDCPELINIINDSKNIIKNWYVVNHGYSSDIFKPHQVEKSINFLIYGALTMKIYPLRNRVANLMEYRKDLSACILRNDLSHNKTIKEDNLSHMINQSWMTLASISTFSYLVRKYFEIAASKSAIIGNMNDQGRLFFNHYIHIDNYFTDEMINNTIKYYLQNKEILSYIALITAKDFQQYDYYKFSHKIDTIIKNITVGEKTDYSYEQYKNSLKAIDRNNYFYTSKIIEQTDDFSMIDQYLIIKQPHSNEIYKNCRNDNTIYDKNTKYTLIDLSTEQHNGDNEAVKQISCDQDLYYGLGKYIDMKYIYSIKRYRMINQIKVEAYLQYFKQDIIARGFIEYSDPDLPSFFYGVGDENLETLQNHRSIAVVVWTGGDLARIVKISSVMKKWVKTEVTFSEFFNKPNFYNIAISSSMSKLLTQNNIKHVKFPFAPQYDYDKFKLLKTKGDCIHFYSSHDPSVYGYDIVREIDAKIGKKYKILYTCSKENYDVGKKMRQSISKKIGPMMYNEIDKKLRVINKNDMADIYKTCFVSIRLTELDGLSSSIQELGLMGIRTINNSVGSPSTIPYHTRNATHIIKLIEDEYKTKNTVRDLGVKDYLSIPLFFYNELFFKFNPNYYFDRIYIINLERDVNKKNDMTRKLEKAAITNYEFFAAVDGTLPAIKEEWDIYAKIPFTPVEQKMKRKTIASSKILGNLYSVRNIIMDAKDKKYKKILILEDDTMFKKDFQQLFAERVEKINQNWCLLFLGCSELYKQGFDIKLASLVNGTYHPNDATNGGFAFAVTDEIYDDLIQECNKKYSPFDSGPAKYIQHKHPQRCLTIYPNLVIADVSKSGMRLGRDMVEFAAKNNWDMKSFDT
jgi:hypothetical protein